MEPRLEDQPEGTSIDVHYRGASNVLLHPNSDGNLLSPTGTEIVHMARVDALVGLGRDLCGASLTELARRLDISLPTASNMCTLHRRMTAEQGDYSQRVASITHAALRAWRSV